MRIMNILPSHEFIFSNISVPHGHLQHHGRVREDLQVKLFFPLWAQSLFAGFCFVLFISQTETTVRITKTYKLKRFIYVSFVKTPVQCKSNMYLKQNGCIKWHNYTCMNRCTGIVSDKRSWTARLSTAIHNNKFFFFITLVYTIPVSCFVTV